MKAPGRHVALDQRLKTRLMDRDIAAAEPLRDVDLALDTEQDFTFQSWLAGEVAENAGLDKIIAAARRYPVRLKEAAS